MEAIRAAGCAFTLRPHPGRSDVAERTIRGLRAEMFVYLSTSEECIVHRSHLCEFFACGTSNRGRFSSADRWSWTIPHFRVSVPQTHNAHAVKSFYLVMTPLLVSLQCLVLRCIHIRDWRE
jgi:hypothetical protein